MAVTSDRLPVGRSGLPRWWRTTGPMSSSVSTVVAVQHPNLACIISQEECRTLLDCSPPSEELLKVLVEGGLISLRGVPSGKKLSHKCRAHLSSLFWWCVSIVDEPIDCFIISLIRLIHLTHHAWRRRRPGACPTGPAAVGSCSVSVWTTRPAKEEQTSRGQPGYHQPCLTAAGDGGSVAHQGKQHGIGGQACKRRT